MGAVAVVFGSFHRTIAANADSLPSVSIRRQRSRPRWKIVHGNWVLLQIDRRAGLHEVVVHLTNNFSLALKRRAALTPAGLSFNLGS